MASLRKFPWKNYLLRYGKALLEKSRHSASYFSFLRRKPALVLEVVKSASLFHAVAVASVLTLLFVAPPVARGVAGMFHAAPKRPLALVQKQSAAAKSFSSGVMTVLWIGSGAGCLLLLWLHIPAAMAAMARRSGRSERQADVLLEQDPDRSLALYHQAIALASDPRDETGLANKIRIAESKTSHVAQTAWSQPQPSLKGALRKLTSAVLLKGVSGPSSCVGHDGRYRLDRPLGQGGMGAVYAGYDTCLGRNVAIKGLPEGPGSGQDFVSRFHQEAKALAALCHPGIVQVYDFVQEHGRVWIVLEYVDGGDLASHLREHGPLAIGEVARLGCLCAEALHYAHEQGVVHRDLKPANVLLTRDLYPKITDFGLARLVGASALTRTGTILGSAPYMSPEQASGKVADRRADVYSLGVTLYELAAGATPFTGDPASVLAQHLTQPPPALSAKRPDAPAALGELIDKMLIKDPEARFADLGAVSAELRAMAKVGAQVLN